MKKKSLWLAFLLSIGLILILGACSGDSEEASGESDNKKEEDGVTTLRMTWWGSQSRHDQTQEIIKKFEEENPDIKIEPEFTGFDGYFEKMAASAAGNNLPDIMQQNFGEYLNQYADKELLADLTPFVEDGTIDVEGVSDTVMESGVKDGKILGIPTGTNALTAFYNKDMLSEAGIEDLDGEWTWEDYEEISTKIHEATGTFGARLMEPKNLFEYYLREQGYKLFNEDGTDLGYEDDQLLVDYFTRNKELVEAEVAPGYDTIQTIKGVEDELIVRGEAAFDFRWSNQATALDSAAGDKQIEMTLLPGENNDTGMYLKPAMLWSVSENSEHKEEAARFIDFFTNNIEVYKIAGSDRGVPIKEEIRNELSSELNDTDKKVYEYIELVTENSSPIDSNFPPQATEVLAALEEVDEMVIYGQLTPEEGAEMFREKATSILGR
ncbi:putative ABC transporter substrate-binding protein YesO [Thalassobacillus devorans]|uniref:ABC transporter substrate-binding protein YesO n=1 Tax=Thalassobacillus devorans TaxID=279813 RepID=A0ABQ1NU19_9BACI|nr:extracellular solute-binding protein [Thalassobacillus devorans]NIK28728.1 multiple sugar transport system substrate-binding protein [Thalassobacillus devorans]GGC84012.1 putative ABC transporter substrate-binding protein YesO [Thalassobacillus devorans]